MITDLEIEQTYQQMSMEIQDAIDEAILEFNGPSIERSTVIMWANTPENIKARIRINNRNLYDRLENMAKGGK